MLSENGTRFVYLQSCTIFKEKDITPEYDTELVVILCEKSHCSLSVKKKANL